MEERVPIDEALVAKLRVAAEAGMFPGLSFEQTMEFLLLGGIFPASGLPVASFLALEAWVAEERASSNNRSTAASDR
jgi:hypothetical protein